MKKEICWYLLIILSFCVLLTGCGKTNSSEQQDGGPLVIMVYMIGSDLEADSGLASADIQEMLDAELDPGVTVYLTAGGSPSWSMKISAEVLPIFQIRDHELLPLEELPLSSMANPGALSAFLQYVHDREQEGRFALILWDHGMGPMEGYGIDLLFGKDRMSLTELSLALEDSPFSKGNRLIWIGFDACLMASLETAAAVKDYADYLLASQEVEPRNGWNYAFLGDFTPEMPVEEQLNRIKSSYLSYYDALSAIMPNYDPTLTLSCLDLRACEHVEWMLDKLFAEINESFEPIELAAFIQQRSTSVSIGRFTSGQDYDLIDVTTLAALYAYEKPIAFAEFSEALADMIVWTAGNADYAHGMSIYCPNENIDAYNNLWKDAFQEISCSQEFCRYIERLVAFKRASTSNCFNTELIPNAEYLEDQYLISLQLNEEQAQYYSHSKLWIFYPGEPMDYSDFDNMGDIHLVAASISRVNGYYPSQRRITAGFNGELFFTSNSSGNEVCVFTLSPDKKRYISRFSLNKPWRLVLEGYDYDDLYMDGWLQIEETEDGNDIHVVGAIMDADTDANDGFHELYAKGKKELDLNEWIFAQFYALDYVLSESGHAEATDLVWINEIEINGEIDIYSRRVEEPLYAMLVLTDVAGNQYETQIIPLAPQ